MPTGKKNIIVIGAGIAGLCAAAYAANCGYEVDVFEQHESAGGLATSWRRGDYTFETCLNWLVGSKPGGFLNSQWKEVFDIDKLTFVDLGEFSRVETEHGESLGISTNVDQMEAQLLKVAPQDAREIRRFASAIRKLASFEIPDPSESWLRSWRVRLRALRYLPLLRRWSRISIADYAVRFRHPLLRRFFTGGESPRLSMIALIMSLAWMNSGNAGYPIGGSQAVIHAICEKLRVLGVRLHRASRVERILVENGVAIGIELAEGEKRHADWVISAADGYATIYEMLQGKFRNKAIDRTYATLEPFPSYVQVSFGIAKNLSQQGRYVVRFLDSPIRLDPGTHPWHLTFRFFHQDPTFAPKGKTAVTCFIPTHNYEFWAQLRRQDPDAYRAEKTRIAAEVTAALDRMIPGVHRAIEVTGISTPATVIRYTNNWKGSMEGWLMTPRTGFAPLRNTLPSLRNFLMIGQWTMPGGGLPSGLLTARSAVQTICRRDHVTFMSRASAEQTPGYSAKQGAGNPSGDAAIRQTPH